MWYQAQGGVGVNLDSWPPGARRPGRGGQPSLSPHLPAFPAAGPALHVARASSTLGAPGLRTQQRPGSFLGVMELCSWARGPAWASSGRDLCLHRCVLWEKQVKGMPVRSLVLFLGKTPELCFGWQRCHCWRSASSCGRQCWLCQPDSWEQRSEERGRGELISRCPC